MAYKVFRDDNGKAVEIAEFNGTPEELEGFMGALKARTGATYAAVNLDPQPDPDEGLSVEDKEAAVVATHGRAATAGPALAEAAAKLAKG